MKAHISIMKGGPGSGHRGHKGRPGLVGGGQADSGYVSDDWKHTYDSDVSKDLWISKLAKKHNMSQKDYILAVNNNLKHIMDTAPSAVIGMKPENVAGFLEDGEYKVSKKFGGIQSNYTDIRKLTEKKLYGITEEAGDSERPIYAAVGDPTHYRSVDVLQKYGLIGLELNENVEDRSTVSFGDSLTEVIGWDAEPAETADTMFIPKPFKKVDIGAVPAAIDIKGNPTTDPLEWKSWKNVSPYIEVQVFGGVKLKDINKVWIPHDWDFKTGTQYPNKVGRQYTKIAELLDSLKIPYELYDADPPRNKEISFIVHKGGKGSGFHGHAGRAGKVGGSSSEGGADNWRELGTRKNYTIVRESGDKKVEIREMFSSMYGVRYYSKLTRGDGSEYWKLEREGEVNKGGIETARKKADKYIGSESRPGVKESESVIPEGSYQVVGDSGDSANVYEVSGKGELPIDLVTKINSNELRMAAAIYNSETKTWHIPDKNVHEVPHGAFSEHTLGDSEPQYREMIQVRGVIDLNNNSMWVYDFTGSVGNIANNPADERRLLVAMERALSSAEYNVPKIHGVSLTFETTNLAGTPLGEKEYSTIIERAVYIIQHTRKESICATLKCKPIDYPISIMKGGPGSGHRGHTGRPGLVGGGQPDNDVVVSDSSKPEHESRFLKGNISKQEIVDTLKSIPGTGKIDVYFQKRQGRTGSQLVFNSSYDYREVSKGWGFNTILEISEDGRAKLYPSNDSSWRHNDRWKDITKPIISMLKNKGFTYLSVPVPKEGKASSEYVIVNVSKEFPVVVANISILKGGPGSGHRGHKGRPGMVGGGQADSGASGGWTETALAKPEDDKDFWMMDIEGEKIDLQEGLKTNWVDKYEDIPDKIVEGVKSKGYLISGEDNLAAITDEFGPGTNDHPGFIAASADREKFGLNARQAREFLVGYMEGDSEKVVEGWKKIFNVGTIRVREFGNEVIIESKNTDKSTLRRLQRLYDAGKFSLSPSSKVVWEPFDLSSMINFTYEEFLDAKFVDTEDGVLKEAEPTFAILKIGTESSGFHGHAGREGQVGGSAPGAGRGYKAGDPAYIAKRRKRGRVRRMQAKLADYKKEHWDNNPSKISDTDWSHLYEYYDSNIIYSDSTFKKMFPYYSGTPKEFIESAFAYADPETGVQSNVHSVRFEQNSVSVTGGFVYPDGRYAGNFSRTLSINTNADGSETVDVHHNLMEMDRDVQGQGFGGRFYRNSELAYAYAGADQITISANMRVGGYAWARMGYDFSEGHQRDLNVSGAKREWDKKNKQTGKNYKFPPFSKRDEPYRFKEDVHAWEIAALTFPDGDRIGKTFMLGSSWSAIKYLDSKHDSYQVGEKYYDLKSKKK